MIENIISIGMCECKEFCKRWWYNENTKSGGFVPYLPDFIDNNSYECKALKNHIFNMKMTIIKKETK